MVASVFFVLQVLCAIIFALSQTAQMLFVSAKGVSLSLFICWEIFFLFNFSWACSQYNEKRNRENKQLLAGYFVWSVLIIDNICVLFLSQSWIWSDRDTWTTAFVIIGMVITVTIAKKKHIALTDVTVKGALAIIAKSIPQIVTAYSIWVIGASSYSPVMMAFGHVTIFLRLGQIALSARRNGWNKNAKASFWSEVANELSWIAVTAIWIWTKL